MEEHLDLARLAVFDGGGERASGVTQPGAGSVDVQQDLVEAPGPDRFLRRETGDAFGAAVPVGDGPVAIDEVDAVDEVVEERLEELGPDGHPAPPGRSRGRSSMVLAGPAAVLGWGQSTRFA
jgi:hypothetical protein